MDTEKRLFLCIVLSMAVILLFTWKNTPPPDQRTASTPSAQNTGAQTTQTPQLSPTETETILSGETGNQEEDESFHGWNWLPNTTLTGESEEVVVESELYRVRLTKHGAIPVSWELLQYEELFAHPRYLEHLIDKQIQPKAKTAQFELQMIEQSKNGEFLPVQAVDRSFQAGNSGLVVRWGRNRNDSTIFYDCNESRVTITEETEITFVYESAGLKLEKIYSFHPDRYHLGFAVRISNKSGKTLTFDQNEDHFDLNWMGGFGYPSLRSDSVNEVYYQIGGSSNYYPVSGVVSELQETGSGLLPEYQNRAGFIDYNVAAPETVNWVAVGHKYFLTGIVPESKTTKAVQGIHTPDETELAGQKPFVGVRMRVQELLDNTSRTEHFTLYIGPKDDERLEQAGAGLEQTHQLILRSFTGPIVKLMLFLLKGFHSIIPNYGIAIILLTIFIKILMFPLYQKNITQMKKMQKIQPQMTALREKFKDDPQKLQKEQFELFKKHKVNPLGGCLTMLPTIPIFIALYATFYSAVELRGAEFFPGWIPDLSAPDQTFFIPIGSFIFAVNVLPLAYSLLMFWSMNQQKIEGPNAIVMKIMPVMMLFFFWTIASGVILYFVISMSIDVAQRLITDRLHGDHKTPEPAKSS